MPQRAAPDAKKRRRQSCDVHLYHRILVLFAFRGGNNVAALAFDGLGKLCRIPSGLRSVLANSHRA